MSVADIFQLCIWITWHIETNAMKLNWESPECSRIEYMSAGVGRAKTGHVGIEDGDGGSHGDCLGCEGSNESHHDRSGNDLGILHRRYMCKKLTLYLGRSWL